MLLFGAQSLSHPSASRGSGSMILQHVVLSPMHMIVEAKSKLYSLRWLSRVFPRYPFTIPCDRNDERERQRREIMQ